MARAPDATNDVMSLTVEILREIRDEGRKTNVRLDELNGRVDHLTGQVGELKVEMRAGFEHLSKRIDNLLVGEHGREHADFRERLVRVEERLGIHPAADQY